MVRTALTLAAAVLAAGCAATPDTASGPKAVAKLEATKGNNASGTVSFTQRGDSVDVVASVSGLKPNSDHGFHVHEKGDCSSGDGMSTGGHFNPLTKAHGTHGAGEHHAGDLPSLKADSYGNAELRFTSRTISVGSGATDVIGKGLIVHRDPDDYKTQPTGNAGPRIACAVVMKG